MERKEFIKKFGLIKTKTKCCFYDGRIYKERTLYKNNCGHLYVLYNNDLYIANPYKYKPNNNYVEGMEKIECYLGAGYSWYH